MFSNKQFTIGKMIKNLSKRESSKVDKGLVAMFIKMSIEERLPVLEETLRQLEKK